MTNSCYVSDEYYNYILICAIISKYLHICLSCDSLYYF